jgi:chemotaxis protein CheC
MMTLTELEQDALTEIFNIGVGVAADALYQLVGEQVPLSVPVVELTSQHHAKSHYTGREMRQLCAIRQTYQGEFTTEAILMFPEDNGLELVRMMVGVNLPDEQLTEMATDAMAELGNIILNAVISNLSSTLKLPLEGSLPTVSVVSAATIFGPPHENRGEDEDAAPVLALMIDFELSANQVRGYLAFLLDEASCEKLVSRLTAYIDGSAA